MSQHQCVVALHPGGSFWITLATQFWRYTFVNGCLQANLQKLQKVSKKVCLWVLHVQLVVSYLRIIDALPCY